ncbi:unnamed protein product [Ceratitis capitata]|uniref:(Mediterranean fruit fly) hypothetical protein n=1 Tax=Ceratitis capitata TaxID=7213 RepID=A0A811V245_CERCA|nr:unnamed protein product [Ceratitis capitata]
MSNSTMRLLIFILACWAPYINALHASAASAGVSFTNDAYGQMQHAPNTQYAASKTLRNRRMYAMCPPHFQRVGSECYSLLPQASSWLEAHFFCKDKNAKLAEPQNRADRKLRTFLKQYDAQNGLTGPIWIGATYDWQSNVWQWSISGKNLTYDAFSRMEPEIRQNLENHCAVFDPNLDYRWSARPCPDKFRFICQHKMPKVSEKNRGKVYTRWNATYPNEYANEVILEVMDQPDRNGHRSNVVVKAEGSDEQILLPKTRSKGGRNRDRQGRRPSNRPISRMTTLHPNDIASQASTNSPTTAVPYNEIAVPITRMSNATNKIIRVQRPRNRGQTPHDRVVWRQRQKEKRRLQRKRERSQRMQQEKEQRLAEQRRLLQENQQRLQQERERERQQQQQQQQQQEQEQEQQDQQQKSHEQTEQPPKRELDELRQREAIDQERQRQQQIQQAEADTKRREYEEHHRELEALKKQLAEEKQRREDEYTSAERIRQERIGRQREREEKERRERKETLRKAEEERAKEEAKREKERLEMEKRQREEYEERLKQAQDERERQLHEQQERKRLEDEANRLRLEEEEKQRQEEIKRQLEEEEKRLELQRLEETRKLERQELDRLAEENRRRKELILKRQEEIARREEEERNILEEEERIRRNSKKRRNATKRNTKRK